MPTFSAELTSLAWAMLFLAFYSGVGWILLKLTRREAHKLREDFERAIGKLDKDLDGLGKKLVDMRGTLHNDIYHVQLLILQGIPEDRRERVLAAIMGKK